MTLKLLFNCLSVDVLRHVPVLVGVKYVNDVGLGKAWFEFEEQVKCKL